MDEVTGEFEVGDSVVVREGVEHPQFDYELSGWQGRVIEIQTSQPYGRLICVEWDSITLANMPRDLLEEADEAGIDWTRAYLLPDALLPTRPRDEERDVLRVAEELSERYESEGYVDEDEISEQEARLELILSGASGESEQLERWAEFLAQNLSFPFTAEVVIFQDQGPLQEGDQVEVEELSLVDDEYGILVAVQHRGNTYDFPLCDLEVVDENTPNFQLIDDYALWYDNRDEL